MFDISKIDFDARKHYAGVTQQQGRIQLDSDGNEQFLIQQEAQRQALLATIGAFGCPDDGFKIGNLRSVDGQIDFDISNGNCFLGGLHLVMDAEGNGESFRAQRDYLQLDLSQYPTPTLQDLPNPGDRSIALVYLKAFQQAVSAIEDTDLFEPALGGADTTARIRTTRKVQLEPNIGADECAEAWQKFKQNLETRRMGKLNAEYACIRDVKLAVSFVEDDVPDDLCAPNATNGYLGSENQAIRIQLTDPDHFSWSFNNAAPLYRVELAPDRRTIKFIDQPKDQYHWPLGGQALELLPWSALLPNAQKIAATSGFCCKAATSYAPGEAFTIDTPVPAGYGEHWTEREDQLDLASSGVYWYLRIWDRGEDLTAPAKIPFTIGLPIRLTGTGLAVTITGDERNEGDFWTLFARPDTPQQVIPEALMEGQGMPPFGPQTYYAPLALIQFENNGQQAIVGEIISDCRIKYSPLTNLDGCCTFSVGDGIQSRGDFQSIEEALQNLPAAGGKICVLPGQHNANLNIVERQNIHISGCGERSILRPHPDPNRINDPIIFIDSAQNITIENLSLAALEASAITILDNGNDSDTTKNIKIIENFLIAATHAIDIHLPEDLADDNAILIANNTIGMLDRAQSGSAIFCIADGVEIRGNRITVVPEFNADDPSDPRSRNLLYNVNLYDPCPDPVLKFRDRKIFQKTVNSVLIYTKYFQLAASTIQYQATGGIQIGGASERVSIQDNEIIGGSGNGISLGHVSLVPAVGNGNVRPLGGRNFPFARERRRSQTFNHGTLFIGANNFNQTPALTQAQRPALYDIAISSNTIQGMGLNGIGIAAHFERSTGLANKVEGLTVQNNRITKCAQQIPSQIPNTMINEVGFGGIVLHTCTKATIEGNYIADNGRSHTEPISGIFIQYAEKLRVVSNQILHNGPAKLGDNTQPQRGPRAGILIAKGFAGLNTGNRFSLGIWSNDGIPAAVIDSNIVVQPHGQALFLIAMGPVSITNNHFVTQGIDTSNPYSELAAAVLVFLLSASNTVRIPRFTNLVNRGLTQNTARATQGLLGAAALPTGPCLFSNNQTTLDLSSMVSSYSQCAQMIVSLDDISFSANQSHCTAVAATLAREVSRPERLGIIFNFGATTATPGTNFTGARPGLSGPAPIATGLQSPIWAQLVSNTITWNTITWNTILMGASIRATDNLLSNNSTATFNSLFVYGRLVSVLGNQATNCLHAYGAKQLVKDNLVLNESACEENDSVIRNTLGILRS